LLETGGICDAGVVTRSSHPVKTRGIAAAAMTCAAVAERERLRDISDRLPTVGGVDDERKTWQMQGPSEVRAGVRFIYVRIPCVRNVPSSTCGPRERLHASYKEGYRAIGSELHTKV
jgi:hypothetical protein